MKKMTWNALGEAGVYFAHRPIFESFVWLLASAKFSCLGQNGLKVHTYRAFSGFSCRRLLMIGSYPTMCSVGGSSF